MSLFLKENRKTKRVTLFHSNFIYTFFIFSPPLKITQHTIKVLIWFWKPSNIQKNYTNASKTKKSSQYTTAWTWLLFLYLYRKTHFGCLIRFMLVWFRNSVQQYLAYSTALLFSYGGFGVPKNTKTYKLSDQSVT